MKKNKTMRLASVLLVLTLLTTCMTAGTFAKYTTSAEGTSSARVAKFGVEVSADAGTVFGKQYDAGKVVVGDSADGITVKTSDDQMVVAPGTSGSMTFSIKGTPETKVNLSIGLTDLKEVMLVSGTYKDMTTNKEITLDGDYYPVKWTLQNESGTINSLSDTTLVKINEYLSGSSISKQYDPNKNLTEVLGGNGTYTLSWKWDFDTNKDSEDTLLGNLQSDTKLVEKKNLDKFEAINSSDYCLEEAFKLTISVTQVD